MNNTLRMFLKVLVKVCHCSGVMQRVSPCFCRLPTGLGVGKMAHKAPGGQGKRFLGRKTVARAEGEKGGREPWDIARFVKTVVFYNEPPSMGEMISKMIQAPLTAVQALMGSSTEERKSGVLTILASDMESSSMPESKGSRVVMVAGATGGAGKRVVRDLLKKGMRVRALVRSMEKGKELLGSLPGAEGGKLEMVTVDIKNRQTLCPEIFSDIKALIICSGAIIRPKEEEQREEKYYQGLKIYPSEVKEDTPEMVDYRGVSNLIQAGQDSLGLRSGKMIFDKSASSQEIAKWGSLDDVVMGGCSQSSLSLEKSAGEDGMDAVVFRGTVTSANSGGFASVRCKNYEPPLNLGAYEGLELRVKGNGLTFKLILRTDTNWDGVGYYASFDTIDGEWQTIKLPFADFAPVFRAKSVEDAAKLDPACVTSIQLMLSKFEIDGELNQKFRLGDFSLPISSMKGYMEENPAPRIIILSAGGVTRITRPGVDLSNQPSQAMNEQLGNVFTYKLKGEDEVRTSGIPFAVVRSAALTEEPKGAPLTLAQGDNLMGKVSREDVAELLVELLSQPTATDTTFEICSTMATSEIFDPEPGSPPRDWAAALESANLRKGVTGKPEDEQ